MKVGENYIPKNMNVMNLMPSLIEVKVLQDGKVGYTVNGGNVIWANEDDFLKLFIKVVQVGEHEYAIA